MAKKNSQRKNKDRTTQPRRDATGSGGLQQTITSLRQAATNTRNRVAVLIFALIPLIAAIAFIVRIESTPVAASNKPSLPLPAIDGVVRAQQEAVAIAEARRREILLTAKSVTNALSELAGEIERWKQVEELNENDDGRTLAADPGAVSAYRAIVRQPRATPQDVVEYRRLVETLVEPTKEAAGTASEFVPDDRVVSELKRHRAQIRLEADKYREHRSAIDAMVAAARDRTPSTLALRTAVQDYERRQSHELAEHIAKTVSEAERDAAGREAEARAEQIRALGEQKAHDLRAETERLKREAESERGRKEQADAQNRLASRADDPIVRAQYAPFLSPSRKTLRFFRNETPQPVSYARMQEMGAMNDHKSFARLGAGRDPRTGSRRGGDDRPKWPYPSTDAEFDQYRPLFEEFRLLAPIWVQQGLLRP